MVIHSVWTEKRPEVTAMMGSLEVVNDLADQGTEREKTRRPGEQACGHS